MVKDFNNERERILKIAKEFGDKIRKLRVEKKMGLREFAQKVNLSPTYISKMERGMDPPPSSDKVIRIAQVLDYDQDKLLALAKKLPPDFEKAFTKSEVYSKRIPEFLRTAIEANLTDAEWKKLIEDLKNKSKK